MRLLLDTHIAVWATEESPQLSLRAINLLQDPANVVFYSDVNLWEVSVKISTRRNRQLGFPDSPQDLLDSFDAAGFERLAIEPAHLALIASLPLHHRDPFDRLLVAQALSEPMRLVTHDRQMAEYSDTVILV